MTLIKTSYHQDSTSKRTYLHCINYLTLGSAQCIFVCILHWVILSTSSSDAPTFSINGNQRKNSENFTYLGTNLSFSGDLTNEIQRRINLVSSAFGRLSKRVFGNQNLTIHTKIVVYNAVVISTILYGYETWVPYRRHIRLLESFHIRRLQLILGLRWWHKVTHSEVRSRAGITTIESMLLHRQLRWLGHVIRMPHSRLSHCVLYGQLRLGHSSVGDKRNASRVTSSRSLKVQHSY